MSFIGSIFGSLFSEVIFRPIFNLLVLALKLFQGNLGFSIIFVTLVIRFLLYKPSSAGHKMQDSMQDIQPKMQEIQEKYEDDPERMSEETMKLLKKSGGGPLKGCLMMLMQIPVFIGLFWTIRALIGVDGTDPIYIERLYSFLHSVGAGFFHVVEGAKQFNLESINTSFFGIELLESKNIGLAILAGLMSYSQMKLTSLTKGDKGGKMENMPGGENMPDMSKFTDMMSIFMVVMIGTLVYSMPAGIGFYIITTTLFSVGQFAFQYREALKVELKALMNKSEK